MYKALKTDKSFWFLAISGVFFIVNACSSTPKKGQIIDPQYGKILSSCEVEKPVKKVYVFEQWHLSPSIDTTTATPQSLAQERNQTAIYSQIENWVQSGKIDILIAEGCEGVIDEKFEPQFNGWSFELLKNNSQISGYNHIITHIPLKIAAKYGSKIQVICGDSNELIEKSNLAWSDIRGLSGFSARLKEYGDNPEKQKNYLDEVITLLKLPKDTNAEVADHSIKEEIRKSIGKIMDYISQRNDVFIKKIMAQPVTKIALVVGGAHVTDLKNKLQKNNIGCDIIEPTGYDFDPDAMFRQVLEK